MGCCAHGLRGYLALRRRLLVTVGQADRIAGAVASASGWRWLWQGLRMTTYVAVYLAAWAIGYVLGFKVRVIRQVMYAA